MLFRSIGGYWSGRLLGHLRFIRMVTVNFSEDGERLINRYGAWAVVLAGLTPIPFSTVCWMAGALKMHWGTMLLAALSRAPRMVIYYLIFKGGFSLLIN